MLPTPLACKLVSPAVVNAAIAVPPTVKVMLPLLEPMLAEVLPFVMALNVPFTPAEAPKSSIQ